MSEQVDVLPVIPVVSVISSSEELKRESVLLLEGEFGPVGLISTLFPFDLSDYYETEMGIDLTRRWCAFSTLRDASEIVSWKHTCVDIEEKFLDRDSNRMVNIDPGYLDYGKLVLASFKSAPDKIYIGRGVWAHTCLRFGNGSFTAPDHSFPDFIDRRFNDFMVEVRKHYRGSLRSLRE